eukprot:CAMPEP_0198720056 /NCGR_PEP_ID=MMETSP1471-20131121/59936_1 /TAXON_ID=41880 /ORGANISM="Pycnococcus provasolii, Strain RCC733" /LENGTH=44 /DNA_ID= /DNA_START= /DNA_END= /DNA_ORIENTATION=
MSPRLDVGVSQDRARFVGEVMQDGAEKSVLGTIRLSVLKLTQVG